ncbi:SPX domain-containing protein [Truncatella angustata]|uniref:SPX domain-containing protein n=1 Tax=Truncatella angustata TaxID=152316 RepID=A0A9P8UKL6_9PEZI|nr:SPX domain-containing protein [Truncatella angustata]KAH6653707.1 SPX domain-containing protein [Truncatella angustata]
MKFAQEFKRSLQQEGFPQKWVDSAIPYGQLKKCLKKVTRELEDLGLDKGTLAQLAADQSTSTGHFSEQHGWKYDLNGEPSKKYFRPRLTVFVHLRNGVAVDAQLSPATRQFLGKIASEKATSTVPPTDTVLENEPTACQDAVSPDEGSDSDEGHTPNRSENTKAALMVQKVEVPLVFDAEFFDILQTDVSVLDALQGEEQQKMKGEIVALGQEITKVSRPSNGKNAKDDLAKWRDIFELYLDARIFFSNRESDHGARTSAQAVEQLQWFQDQVVKRKLVQKLKLQPSREAFTKFLNVNAMLLQNLKFQEINQLAIKKILKKFDKRTSLGVAQTFSVAVHSERLLAGSVAKDLCAQVSSEIISAVPQLDDYLCPICFAIAYWPIRLECDHVFCSRCLVKMQRKGERFCPLCRGDVIMKAGMNNFDHTHANFLKEYFPKEVKEKIKANELERGKEIFGPDYSDRPCSVM